MDAQLKQLVLNMAAESIECDKVINALLTAMKQSLPQLGGEIKAVVQPVQQDANAIRSEKMLPLTLGLPKSDSVNDFRGVADSEIADSDITEWIRK